jgi:uncharacterized membrane protein YphA (DoxX/SURF4 family)
MSPKSGGGSASLPIQFLQWAVGIVVLIASVRTFFHSAHKLSASGSNPHSFFLPLLAGVEILGAVLFLIPRMSRIGSYLLLVVFGIALLFHLAHSDWDSISMLVVYIAAVVAVRASSGGF